MPLRRTNINSAFGALLFRTLPSTPPNRRLTSEIIIHQGVVREPVPEEVLLDRRRRAEKEAATFTPYCMKGKRPKRDEYVRKEASLNF
jgi:hypothetical protein